MAVRLLLEDVPRLEGKGLGWLGHTWWVCGSSRRRAPGICCPSSSANPACRRSQATAAVPWGVSGMAVGSARAAASPGARSEQPLAEEPRAALDPCPSQRRPGIPAPGPGCVWQLPATGRTLRHSPSPAGTKDKRGWFPPWGSASSRPAFPAGWATRREHRGTFLAGSRSPRGLRAAPGSAPTVSLGCERSPAGNASAGGTSPDTLQNFGLGPREPSGLVLLVSLWKGTWHQHLYSHQGNAGKGRKSGLREEFCAVAQLFTCVVPWSGAGYGTLPYGHSRGWCVKQHWPKRKSCIGLGIPLLALGIPIPGGTLPDLRLAWLEQDAENAQVVGSIPS